MRVGLGSDLQELIRIKSLEFVFYHTAFILPVQTDKYDRQRRLVVCMELALL
jgi:hypothetical protein